MKMYNLLWIIPLGIGGFVAFWCLVVKLVSLAGWNKLATYFEARSLPQGQAYSLRWARINLVNYKGVLGARVSTQGLGLEVGFPFNVGHPPVLIPWAAFGTFRVEKVFLATHYTTRIKTSGHGETKLSFSSEELLEAVRPYVRVELG